MSGPAFAPRAAGFPLGITGAVAPTRYVGGTVAGAPTTGTFAVGDFVIDQSGIAWVCTAAGTPGTWRSQAATELAYQEITSGQTGISATADVTNLAITFATGARPAMLEAYFPLVQQVTSAGVATFFISDASNNNLSRAGMSIGANAVVGGVIVKCRLAAGLASATYKVRATTNAGTLSILVANTGADTYKPYIRAVSV